MATDFDGARQALRRKAVRPFHPWRLVRPRAAIVREADNELQNGWVREADREVIELAPPYPWDAAGVPAVAVAETHGWGMLDALLGAHSTTGSWAHLEPAIELAEDWFDHGAKARGSWAARTIPMRAHRLAYLVHAAAVEDAVDNSRWRALARLAQRHSKRLDDVEGTLEGLLADLARSSLHGRLGDHLAIDPPSGPEGAAWNGAFDHRGAVASPAPADHVLVVAALAATDLDNPDADLTDLRRAAEDGLAWLIATDGQPATFGATSLEPVNGRWRGGDVSVQELTEPLASDALTHVLSAGAAGVAPTADTRVLDGAGILVAKPVWNRYGAEAGYAAMQTTGDLVWHDAGRALVMGVGTTADALEGGASDRIERGAAWLSESRASNGLAVAPPIEPDTTHRIGVLNERIFFDVSGADGTCVVRRSVVVGPGWLFVADWLTDDGGSHDASQRFLLGPGLDAIADGDGYVASDQATPTLWAATVHGSPKATGPQRGGDGSPGAWWAPRPGRIAPATQIGWTDSSNHVLIASVLSVSGPVQRIASGDWSFAFRVGDTDVGLSLGRFGLEDIQETAT